MTKSMGLVYITVCFGVTYISSPSQKTNTYSQNNCTGSSKHVNKCTCWRNIGKEILHQLQWAPDRTWLFKSSLSLYLPGAAVRLPVELYN